MRVDELVSGIRSDVAVKLFGEDLNILKDKAAQIAKVMETVRGQTDLQLELEGSGQVDLSRPRQNGSLWRKHV